MSAGCGIIEKAPTRGAKIRSISPNQESNSTDRGDSNADSPQQAPSATFRRKQYSPHIEAVIERACQGDRSVLPELKRVLDEHPELVEPIGDLFEHARQAQLQSLAGDNLYVKEATVRTVDKMRAELMSDGDSVLERLLIDRISLDWLALQSCDMAVSNLVDAKSGGLPNLPAATQRLDAASRRFNNAVKTLATIRRLLRPIPSTLDLMRHPRAPASSAFSSIKRDAPLSEGLPLVN